MKLTAILLLGLALLPTTPSAKANYIDLIAPASAAGVEGNSSQIPLNTGGPERFQQVYSENEFSAFPDGVAIGEISFRSDAFLGHAFDHFVSDIEIHLSTTSKQPDSLSPVFDQNVGSDDRIVIGRSPFLFIGGGGGGVIGAWSLSPDFTSNPFIYKPSNGNLLLDIKVFSGASSCPFDAVDVNGDTVSSVFSYGATIPTSGQATSLGVATLFVVQPIPEPSTLALFSSGIVFVGLFAAGRITRKGRIS